MARVSASRPPAGRRFWRRSASLLLQCSESWIRHRPATEQSRCAIFLAPLSAGALDHALRAQKRLREQGVAALMDYEGRSMKSQMKRADKLGARYVAILGDDELAKGAWTVRDMRESSQESVALADLPARMIERVARG